VIGNRQAYSLDNEKIWLIIFGDVRLVLSVIEAEH